MGYEYIAKQNKWIIKNNIRVGTKVRIFKEAESYENEWDCEWTCGMTDNIGEIGTICSMPEHDDDTGILIEVGSSIYWYPYFILEPVLTETETERKDEDIKITDSIANIESKLKLLFPNGHQGFIPLTIKEMELHSEKNHDYTHGGDPLGNFNRVSAFLDMYPGLDPGDPVVVAAIYLMKQLDAALWLRAKKYKAVIQGEDERWQDVSVYSKIIRLIIQGEKS